MRREDYYQNRPNPDYRGDYQRNQRRPEPNPNQSAIYNNNYGQPQPPYYPPRRHHHVFLWIVVIILCLGLGWFAADHFLGDSQSSSPQTTTVNRSTTVNKTGKSGTPRVKITDPQEAKEAQVEKEMNQLDVSQKKQGQAIQFYEKQNTKNQAKIMKMIGLVNKLVPSETMKRQILNWILS